MWIWSFLDRSSCCVLRSQSVTLYGVVDCSDAWDFKRGGFPKVLSMEVPRATSPLLGKEKAWLRVWVVIKLYISQDLQVYSDPFPVL